MATLTLTGNAATLLRLLKETKAAVASTADNRNVTVVLDDADFSVTYTDGAYGSKKKAVK